MINITEQIQVIMYTELKDELQSIREQPEAANELKRFVNYVLDNTGSFGTVDKKLQIKNVDWQKIIDERG